MREESWFSCISVSRFSLENAQAAVQFQGLLPSSFALVISEGSAICVTVLFSLFWWN